MFIHNMFSSQRAKSMVVIKSNEVLGLLAVPYWTAADEPHFAVLLLVGCGMAGWTQSAMRSVTADGIARSDSRLRFDWRAVIETYEYAGSDGSNSTAP